MAFDACAFEQRVQNAANICSQYMLEGLENCFVMDIFFFFIQHHLFEEPTSRPKQMCMWRTHIQVCCLFNEALELAEKAIVAVNKNPRFRRRDVDVFLFFMSMMFFFF